MKLVQWLLALFRVPRKPAPGKIKDAEINNVKYGRKVS